MPSIVSFDAGIPDRQPLRSLDPSDPAPAWRVARAVDLDGLLAAAASSDAACIAFGVDPEPGLEAIRRLRAAEPDLSIVATEVPGPEVALAAAEAGAHESTPRAADERLVLLALRRAASRTADHRELRRLRAQHPVGASASPLSAVGAQLGDAQPVAPLREIEREAIRQALAATGGRVGQAAKMLGMGRATLYRRLATFEAARNS